VAINTDKLEFMAAAYAAAWSSGNPGAVGGHYATDGKITINQGDPLVGRDAVTEMAAGFMAEFPDLMLTCDFSRISKNDSQNRAVFAWTLKGHHAVTENFVKISGWEEWDLGDDLKVKTSLGWFDGDDYQRQISGT
tara:strand:- start:1502 stop:1909 length:408 start_codon:yes stop_codon:yes gene_type:complete